MWKALPWDPKCVPCLESVLLCLFSGRKLGFCLFLFTGERLLKLSGCRFSVELRAELLEAVLLLCGHHITTGRRFQEHPVVYRTHLILNRLILTVAVCLGKKGESIVTFSEGPEVLF